MVSILPQHNPSTELPFGCKDLDYHEFNNEIFFIEKCDLGLGTFATRDLKAGEVILRFEGPLIDFRTTKQRGQWECMPIQIARDVYIDTRAPGVFVNHSCNPNAGIRHDHQLIALYDILKGEEVRFDYSTTMQENSYKMECRCFQHNCRGVISDFSTLPIPKQMEYLHKGVVMRFIADRID